ncbi:hypothetical protein SPRG_02843 [Saprolegnia parasitica CBS 223.65]|uniref:Uncharacterized protein n=1 Tax=Saprolegnia parasitica (strain CBS 223.65) TaxID=695850 RepID=A0A067D0S4_SAPPC|nr:hypothetical protein SPRG_02843 [Saprolegnia parasitica CBS 223.65]KDO32366.1 hypothetical protein SPRG_02843 [Saprolegnia parasitica CBS 223.65]|eukprot:XP_012196820.1 hypothetical protein SPRG_02843 [Saprolegnia parasitica CBS 223.65]
MAASTHPTGTLSAARLFMMPRRSEPQLPLHMNPPRLRAATTTAYRSLPPHLEEPRLRLAPLKRTSGLKPPAALEDDDDVPPELVEHMFAITPPSTPALDDDDDFRRTISPIAVIEPAASRQLTLLESLMSLAHRLGVFIFVDMVDHSPPIPLACVVGLSGWMVRRRSSSSCSSSSCRTKIRCAWSSRSLATRLCSTLAPNNTLCLRRCVQSTASSSCTSGTTTQRRTCTVKPSAASTSPSS